MSENERQLCLICKIYEYALKNLLSYEEANKRATRLLQIRQVVNCKNEEFKSFLAKMAKIEPNEYLEYYNVFELDVDRADRLKDVATNGAEPYFYEEDEEDEEDEEEKCATCFYFNSDDDCCDFIGKHCFYSKKEEE
jgi:hypothetical protein